MDDDKIHGQPGLSPEEDEQGRHLAHVSNAIANGAIQAGLAFGVPIKSMTIIMVAVGPDGQDMASISAHGYDDPEDMLGETMAHLVDAAEALGLRPVFMPKDGEPGKPGFTI